jgi:hypothetical protein
MRPLQRLRPHRRVGRWTTLVQLVWVVRALLVVGFVQSYSFDGGSTDCRNENDSASN